MSVGGLMKEIWFNGIKFTKDDKTGYYLNSSIRKRLHRYVWELHYGEIPEGYHIHHIDFDKSNNDISNLQLMSKEEHMQLHGELNKGVCSDNMRQNLNNIRHLTKEWHSSDEGHNWHKEHYKTSLGKKEYVEIKCDCCGETFMSRGSRPRFCSNKCKSKYRRIHKLDYITETCVICGKEFSKSKYSKGVTCTRSCANKLVWKQKKSDL